MIDIDLREVICILKKNSKFILLITLLFLVISGVISFYYLTPIYEARIMLTINTQVGDVETQTKILNTYAGQVKSEVLMQRVINKMHLVGFTRHTLSRQINVTNKNDSNIIEITVRNSDPQLAADIANKLGQEFIVLTREKNQEIFNETISFYQNQINETQQKLNASVNESEKRLFEDALVLLNDRTRLAQSIDTGSTSMVVVSQAFPPVNPVSPNKILIMVIAFILGLMVSMIVVCIKETINSKIKSAEDVAQHLDLPVLGVIAHADRNACS